MKRKTVILGGGTFQPIRNHLSICAPAFGTTARRLHEFIPDSELHLTKMADSSSKLITNEDVELLVDLILDDESIGTLIFNIAFCDFKAKDFDGIKNGFHADRLKTSEGDLNITLTPTEKIIAKVRKVRPDIFLIGFKTTTNKSSDEQFKIALKMMKSVKCNLVLANDTVTRNNMIITAEESIYGEGTDREYSLKELAEITIMRQDLTYNRTNFIKTESISIKNTPDSFRNVIKFLIDNGGFIENNGNGFTPGHFCYAPPSKDCEFYSSQRKANHNKVFEEGMSVVKVKGDKFTVYGDRKASVGARSQFLALSTNFGDFDCIVHTHNPLKKESKIPIASQKPFQCGSLECGINTVTNMKLFNDNKIKAVYLDKHGANILFNSKNDSNGVIQFIKDNIKLGEKVK